MYLLVLKMALIQIFWKLDKTTFHRRRKVLGTRLRRSKIASRRASRDTKNEKLHLLVLAGPRF